MLKIFARHFVTSIWSLLRNGWGDTAIDMVRETAFQQTNNSGAIDVGYTGTWFYIGIEWHLVKALFIRKIDGAECLFATIDTHAPYSDTVRSQEICLWAPEFYRPTGGVLTPFPRHTELCESGKWLRDATI